MRRKQSRKLMLRSGAFYVLRRALCDVIFATGTMLDPLCGSSVLLLLAFLPFVSGVCPSCHGDAPGCTATDWASCLWNQGLATNVAAFAVVGATGVAKLGTLLPPKLLKMFNPRTVERLQMLSSRLRHGNLRILQERLLVMLPRPRGLAKHLQKKLTLI